jgi:insulysin
LSKISEIIGYTLQYIEMLKQATPQQWVIEEIQRVNKMKFDYMTRSQGMSFCSKLAKLLHQRKMEELIIYPYLMEEFKPELINDYLGQLRLDNLVVILESKTLEGDCTEVEPIYKSKYAIQALGDIKSLECKVELPGRNVFIPDDLTVLPLGTQRHPTKLYESPFIEAYFKKDHEFELPKAILDLRIYFDGQNSVR